MFFIDLFSLTFTQGGLIEHFSVLKSILTCSNYLSLKIVLALLF